MAVNAIQCSATADEAMKEFDGPDFVMTYPCFILMRTEETPATINVEGRPAICLFTDSDNLFQFHARHVPELARVDSGCGELHAAQCEDRITLLRVLQELKPDLAKGNIERVAIDPTYGRGALTAKLPDFIDMLWR